MPDIETDTETAPFDPTTDATAQAPEAPTGQAAFRAWLDTVPHRADGTGETRLDELTACWDAHAEREGVPDRGAVFVCEAVRALFPQCPIESRDDQSYLAAAGLSVDMVTARGA